MEAGAGYGALASTGEHPLEGAASLADTAYARLKDSILNGELPANAMIDELETARGLGSSRTPVREALLRLQSEGLIEIARGRGIRVTPVSAQEMAQLYQTITPTETMAVYAAALRARDGVTEPGLDAALEAMEDAASHGNYEAWGHADEHFHRELLRASGNPFLTQVGLQLRDRAQRAHLVAARMQSPEYRLGSTQNHRRVVERIRSGNALAAARDHLRQRLRGEAALVSIFDRYGLKSL